jgi:hypothetical protein
MVLWLPSQLVFPALVPSRGFEVFRLSDAAGPARVDDRRRDRRFS